MNKANKELEKHMKGSRKLHELIKFIYIIGHILSNVCLSRGITEEIFLHLSECYWQATSPSTSAEMLFYLAVLSILTVPVSNYSLRNNYDMIF